MPKPIRALLAAEHILLLLMLALTGVAAESLSMDVAHAPFWILAVGGGGLGIMLASSRTPDSFSHLIAIVGGAAGTIALTAYHQLPGDEAPGYWARYTQVAVDLKDWYLGTAPQDHLEDMLIMILLQMIVWLMAYLAAWSLVRQRWLTVAILIPAVLVIVTMVFGTDAPGYLLELVVVVAILLMARVTMARRESTGPSHSRGMAAWFALVPALVVAILVVGIGTAFPRGFSHDTIRPVAGYAGERYLDAQEQAVDWIARNLDLSNSDTLSIDQFPRYTSFDDAFSVGGDLNLSERPEVLVKINGDAPYLTAQSYDTYTGRGWESTVEDTFEPDAGDGVRYSPELTFHAGQQIPYAAAASRDRVPVSMEVIPLSSNGEMMYSTGMYLSADESTSVRMSWLQLNNHTYPLRDMDLSTLPPDLLAIVAELLRAQDLSVARDNGLLYPDNPAARERLVSVQEHLADRFVHTSWTVGDDGRVESLIVTGQLPVYEDNVRVSRASGAGAGSSYEVTSLVSDASADQLRSTSGEYPEWVTDRYLALPDSVTQRTVDLAAQLTSAETNPYDRARAIESFLRQHIQYDLDVGVPPEGTDIVDYVLFESQRGYCEYYASAMTVMLRALGIPAKTVVGYYPGDYDQEMGGYVYRQKNAHAWTEAYFPGYGWIRFEPTSSQPASTFGDVQYAPPPTPTPTAVPPTVAATAVASSTPVPPPVDESSELPQPVTVQEDDSVWPSTKVLIGSVIGAAAVAIAGALLFLSRRDRMSARALFTSLVRWGRAGGIADDPTTTAREMAQRLGQRYPRIGPDAFDVASAYEDDRYGPAPASPSRVMRASQALQRLRRHLMRSMLRMRS